MHAKLIECEMDEQPTAPILSAKERIEITLKEHATLCAEKVARLNHRNSILSIVLGGATLFGTLQPTLSAWLVGAGAVIIFLFTWWRYGVLIKLLAGRIGDIERKVNAIAGEE